MKFLHRHGQAIEAAAAFVTASAAVFALIGVWVQLSEADRVAREATAREAYRNHLALAVANPAFASPSDAAACTLLAGEARGAYAGFVDHMLYSAEQMLELESGWEPTFREEMLRHRVYMCQMVVAGEGDKLAAVITAFQMQECAAVPVCPE